MVLATRFVHFRIHPLSKRVSLARYQGVMKSLHDPGDYGTRTRDVFLFPEAVEQAIPLGSAAGRIRKDTVRRVVKWSK